ncbi:fimbria/pilus outer membrane usher protein [Persephonella hydrogeniphila]|nr:fimbria/pilus outer membrane usher protein [Persephonella hydrogeniphila]
MKREKTKPVESKGWFVGYDTLYSKYSENQQIRTYIDFNYFFSNKVLFTDFLHYYSDEENRLIRSNTTLRIDDIENIRKIEIGDIYSQNSIWNYYLRVGGIRVGTDYNLRPDIITYPLPDFAGKVAAPSSVDIFVNNAKVFSQDLKPGPFEIRDIPVVTPEGNVKVIIKDVLGREKVIEIPYFTSKNLLKEGLSEYSVTTGFLRKNYLKKDFDYSKFVTSGSYRKGITNRLTVGFDSYLQGMDGLNAGVTINYLLNRFGLFSPTLSLSRSQNGTGFQYGLEYSKNFTFLRVRLAGIKSSDKFFQPNSVFGSPKDYYNALIGLNLSKFGFINFSYIKRTYFDSPESTNINLSYTKNLFNRINISMAYNIYKSNITNRSFRGSISIPLGNKYSSSLTFQKNKDQKKYTFNFSKQYDPAEKLFYRGRFDRTDSYNNLYGEVGLNTEYTSLYSQISYITGNGNSLDYRLGAQGSLIYIDGNFFLRKAVQNSFGIVKIEPPVENAEVIANNKPVGKTDKNGTLFLPSLYPYYPNEIKINPASLDMKTYIDKNILSFIPYKDHGYIIKFRSKKINSVRLKILFPEGEFPEPGTSLYVDGKKVGVIGYKGKAFIENISEGEHTVTIDYGYSKCDFKINIGKEVLNKVVPFIGEYLCDLKDNRIIAKKEEKHTVQKIYIERTKPEKIEDILKKKTTTKKHTAKKEISKQKRLPKTENEVEISVKDYSLDSFDTFEEFLEFRESLRP